MAPQLKEDLVRAGLLEGAFSIPQFCVAFSLSRGQFYKLRKDGRGPVIMDAGKPLISYAAAAAWRRSLEARALEVETNIVATA
jgi:hypothetical protein